MSDNIKVVVKVRPLIRREIDDKHIHQWRVNNNSLVQIDQNGRESGACFAFDKVYDENTKTADVYNNVAKPIVEAATAGFNGTIFAYGQTSSGKTYTMTGTEEEPGIIPLAVVNLFNIIKNVPDRDFLVRVSYIEIYNETLIDLLNLEKKNIKIHESFQGGVKVDATEKLTTSPTEVLELMNEGKANRQMGATNMNEESSRSHSIFQITIESREHIEGEEEVGSVNVSQLNLVDLAGSERSGQTGATGIRFKEGTHINKSLSSLALVIKQLSEDRNKHMNYRDSKLTRILQNSLGGNAKTSIICAVTPAAVEETISTLQFANRAKAIKNTPAVNAVATNATMIQSLTKQLSTLKTQLESKKNVEQVNVNLQKQIENLQKVILNGFSQRSSTDLLGGARRKLHQPRRMTISTLHPIQEDALPPMPKFCTPSLKYNPLSLNTLPEFAPIHSASSLCSVAEEPRLVTPPPTGKKVTISEEIIEIDSDDDGSLDVQTCSPYHGCYQSLKTPPCILRKNAKQAEKNLKEIVELTERERIYAPNVVELMEKLERQSKKIAELEENTDKLHKLTMEKDKEMGSLKSKINEADQQVQDLKTDKTNMQTDYNNCKTKITEWEVSYETLQKKSKRREEELLSLLHEHEIKKKNEEIGKISSKAFEGEQALPILSRNMVSGNSENEDSIINIKYKLDSLLSTNIDLENQLSVKNQTISQLEANILAQKHQIDSLENGIKEFQSMVSEFNEKISLIDNENALQKATINHLIESKKSSDESVKAEIESYKKVIEELKMQLCNKENVSTNVIDSDLELMIANEKMFIANNENMKNIIKSFRTTLDLRNEEIKTLKLTLSQETIENVKSLEEELYCRKQDISKLSKEVESLKKQSTDNTAIIEKIMIEKSNLLSIEHQLKTRLLELQSDRDSLEKKTEAHLIEIANLTKDKGDLNSIIKKNQCDASVYKEKLQKEVEKLSEEVKILQNENKYKDSIIFQLRVEENATRENLMKAKSILKKLQNILVLMSGNILEIPEVIDNLVTYFGMFFESLTSLENIAKNVIKEKNDLRVLVDEYENTFIIIKSQIDDLDKALDKNIVCIDNNLCNLTEIQNGDTKNTHQAFQYKIDNIIEKIKTTTAYFNKSLQDKDIALNDFKLQYEMKLKSETAKHSKENEMQGLLLKDVLNKTSMVASQLGIEFSRLQSHIESDSEKISEYIVLLLNKIADSASLRKVDHEAEFDNMKQVLTESRKEIDKLTEENLKLLQEISNLENNNVSLCAELKNKQNDSKILTTNLKESDTILNNLRLDVVSKTSQIEILENKAKEWKNKFRDLEILRNDQIHILEIENKELKAKYSELEMLNKQCHNVLDLKRKLSCGEKKNVSSISTNYTELISPPSLLTICCHRLLEYIQPDASDYLESSSSASSSNFKHIYNISQQNELMADIDSLREENSNLKEVIDQLQAMNDCLVKDQVEVQKEVQLLVENTQDLQKKVVNHRTNLSTLTATTYAENRLLSSQLKFLQHHHNRFHNVCEKDISAFKKQLQELMIFLKTENIHKHNESIKRHSLPINLDVTFHSKFKNDSTLDSELLMLDTNITCTTLDNTLIGHDQSYLDVTRVCTYNEVASQTSLNEITNCDLLHSQMDMQPYNYEKLLETLESLKAENHKLRDLVNEYSKSKTYIGNPTDYSRSSNVIQNDNKIECNIKNLRVDSCHSCNHAAVIREMEKTHKQEIEVISKRVIELETQKRDVEETHRNLILEIPSTEILVQKINSLEKECFLKQNEVAKFTQIKNEELRLLQDENDLLSNQVMENITELDALKKEHDTLNEKHSKLSEKCLLLEKEITDLKYQSETQECTECKLKSEIISNLEKKLSTEACIKLDRSYSDSESSSRCNKICTLQNELHAGKEDCIELKEEVTTIKNHLERNNLSISQVMHLDDDVESSHMYTFDDDFENQSTTKPLSNICKDNFSIIYNSEKDMCLSYYVEKTGNKESLTDISLIDLMKMLYDYIVTKHANEVENLVNKLKDFEESKDEINKNLNNIKIENEQITKELDEKNNFFQTMANVIARVNNNIAVLSDTINNQDVLVNFKDNFLKIVDVEFGLASTAVFDVAIQNLHQKHITEVERLRNDKEKLEYDIQERVKNLSLVNENLSTLKSQLTKTENEFNLLQKQKENLHEINSVLTLEIVKREDELRNQITSGFHKLIGKQVVNADLTLPANKLVDLLLEQLLNQSGYDVKEQLEKEKNSITVEIDSLKTVLKTKEDKLNTLTTEFVKIQEINSKILSDLTKKDQEFKGQVEENDKNLKLNNKLIEEVNLLKEALAKKETLILSLETKLKSFNENNAEKDTKVAQLLESIVTSQNEIENLKAINQIIITEKDEYSLELDKAKEIIKQNQVDFDKMTTDISVLKETIKENLTVTDNLRKEFETLKQAKENLDIINKELQVQIHEKCRNCSRLEMNVKTLEKTAEIQSKMIQRHQKQKEDDDKMACEKDLKLEELTQQCKSLAKECEQLTNDIKFSRNEIEVLKSGRLLLETRITDLEHEVRSHKRRSSMETTAESTRRRRQSIHDSKRAFAEDIEEHKHANDSLMDVDGDSSSRSTPIATARGHDSLSSKHDQSDKDEEHSRSGSVLASRRRRQSVHDLHRSVRVTPEPRENSRECSRNNSIDSEVALLRKQLSSCHQEIEELKEKYREVDEECEICAEYLRERDAQCARLKKEKRDLEQTIVELKEKLKNSDPNNSQGKTKTGIANAAVNTDEDWANLHSVVVDRMSFDAEVEKNKKLMKTIEELRFRKEDLKTTVAKMQKALEKHSVKEKELEATKASLASCESELAELKQRYKELDEECDTCAAYLRERDEQCRQLREAKAALEARLQELAHPAAQSLRRKRQALHDQRRERGEAATDTTDDLLTYQVERDDPTPTAEDKQSQELRRLKVAYEKVSQQKAEMEQQLSCTPLYVATGSAIVQNQQLTDVMKENQKLKKMNAKLITICKKRGKSLADSNRENEDPSEQVN